MIPDADLDRQFKYILRRPDLVKTEKLMIFHQPNPNSGAHDHVCSIELNSGGFEWEYNDILPFSRSIARAYLKKIRK